MVSGQLDVDRLDYLTRDSFFSGVAEGVIGTERIIKMLNVSNQDLVADVKAIYSIEKFIISRRLMYWQVYLHKTVHVAEVMLVLCLRRAKELWQRSPDFFLPEKMRLFFENDYCEEDFRNNPSLLDTYADLTDEDIWFSLKQWRFHSDRVLSMLSERLYNRGLFRIEMSENPFPEEYILRIRQKLQQQLLFNDDECDYLLAHGKMGNRAYDNVNLPILIMDKDGHVHPLEQLSDHLNHRTLSENVSKFFIAYPKELQVKA